MASTDQIHAIHHGDTRLGLTKIGGYFDADRPIGDVIRYLMTDAKYCGTMSPTKYDLYWQPSGSHERVLIGALELIDPAGINLS